MVASGLPYHESIAKVAHPHAAEVFPGLRRNLSRQNFFQLPDAQLGIRLLTRGNRDRVDRIQMDANAIPYR